MLHFMYVHGLSEALGGSGTVTTVTTARAESLRSDLISGNFPCVLMSVAEQLPSHDVRVIYTKHTHRHRNRRRRRRRRFELSSVESCAASWRSGTAAAMSTYPHTLTHTLTYLMRRCTSIDVVLQVNPVSLAGECAWSSSVWNTAPQLKHTHTNYITLASCICSRPIPKLIA